MTKNPYEVLGVSPLATDEEIKDAYRALARKYHPDNYAADPAMAELAEEKMKEINLAYDAIMDARGGGGGVDYAQLRAMLSQNKFAEVERILDGIDTASRGAEWHFLRSICYDRRGRVNDAMNELNIACNMDPSNDEYVRSRNVYAQRAGAYGSAYRQNTYGQPASSSNDACNCCSQLIIADCCCECMGGDLISCC
ncbi:MAG: DnaJ domain-containing protein [Clostridia bacterium]|nr:DnaJ domain-containing protein [Clostridia bacterium]